MTARDKQIRVLLLNPQQSSTIEGILNSIPVVYATRFAAIQQALDTLERDDIADVIMVDLQVAQEQLAAVQMLQAYSLPIIVLGTRAQEDEALELLRCGAQDYLIGEDLDLDGVTRALRYAINVSRLQRRVQALDRHLEVANHRLRELFLPTTERVLEGPVGRRRVRSSVEQ